MFFWKSKSPQSKSDGSRGVRRLAAPLPNLFRVPREKCSSWLMKRGRSFFHHFHHARRAVARPYRRLSIRAKNKTDEKGTVFFLSLSSRTTRHGASLQAAIDARQKQNCNIPWTFTGQRWFGIKRTKTPTWKRMVPWRTYFVMRRPIITNILKLKII